MNRDEARALATELEARTLSVPPPIPIQPGNLFVSIRTALVAASDEGILRTGPGDIYKWLRKDGGDGEVLLVNGGEGFDKGQPAGEFFLFKDGARLSFSLAVDYRTRPPRLMSYRFFLRLPSGGQPAFVRLDLNPGLKESALVEPRSHIHPGHDDVRLPAPVMSPLEILGTLLFSGIASYVRGAVRPCRPEIACNLAA